MMRVNLVSLFPEFFDSPLSCGLMAKAVEAGLVSFDRINPRTFATDPHRTVDDRPYGGGPGMVMLLETLARALRSIDNTGRILVMSPSGKPFTQAMALELSRQQAMTLVCGRYEGIDARLAALFPPGAVEEVSVGDMVLNGGEAAALCVTEAVTRLLPGFMGHEGAGEEESFSKGLLEYPHYTRPDVFEGYAVPEVLRGGDHGAIAAWRHEQALGLTRARRPGLLADAPLSPQDLESLAGAATARLGRNLHVALLHHPVQNARGETVKTSLTNLDVHDIGRVSRSYGLAAFHVVTPLADQQRLLREITGRWESGYGASTARAEALGLVRGAHDLDEVVTRVAEEVGQEPRLLMTSAKVPTVRKALKRWPELVTAERVREWLGEGPVVMVLGTGHGLARRVMERGHGLMRPVRAFAPYNHLSVRAALAIMVERILGEYC